MSPVVEMAFSYPKLPSRNSTRLIQLLPGIDDTPLEAQLTTHQVENLGRYEALSYVWGVSDLSKALVVDGRLLNISENLFGIVSQLRLSDRVRTLWIDAICINQDDNIERGAQLAMMGQIYRQAETVLCWLGDSSAHKISALNFLQGLAEEAGNYIDLGWRGDLWSVVWDDSEPPEETVSVITSALEAHIESVFDHPWFTRLWITQEVSLAENPVIFCGNSSISWRDFEVATRVLANCLNGKRAPATLADSMDNAWSLMISRARYQIIAQPAKIETVIIEVDILWSLGRLAWESKHKHCKDDRDRVYALLSLVVTGSAYKVYVPKPFTPDYTRSVEWAYGQFWSRFGGYSSLYYAGFSRRGKSTSWVPSLKQVGNGLMGFDEKCLPSWCPDLRPNPKEWEPIFSGEYAASTPMHHMECHLGDSVDGPGPLLIRGHRFDIISLGFHISREFKSDKVLDDAIDLRRIMKLFVALQHVYSPYPDGKNWIDALGFALMTDVPPAAQKSYHPFQYYTSRSFSHFQLKNLWRRYLTEVIAEDGVVWRKLNQVMIAYWEDQMAGNVEPGQKLQFDPFIELTPDGQLAWRLHRYLGDVLQRHRFIITQKGWMGLAPPDTAPGDVVVVVGGPDTASIVRDTPMTAMCELVPIPIDSPKRHSEGTNVNQTEVIPSSTGTPVSQLLGPCYLQGIMNGELYTEKRYETELEWETDRLGTIPKPTIYLI